MLNMIRPAVAVYLALTLITGVLYPAVITLTAQLIFPHEANGSLIKRDGRTIGSELIDQEFRDPRYFWGRPSATSPAYNGGASCGSNLGPLNPALLAAVEERAGAFRLSGSEGDAPIPVDLVTASGSGLDPHISIAGAGYQVHRVAAARALEGARLETLINRLAIRPMVPGFGEPIINVLELNLALDEEMR